MIKSVTVLLTKMYLIVLRFDLVFILCIIMTKPYVHIENPQVFN